MRIIRKYGFVLFLAFAVIYVYAPLKLEDVANLPWVDDITATISQRLASARPRAEVSPVDRVAAANVDEDLDYQIALRKKSADGWRSFLAAHPNGPHAQSARTEMEELGSPGIAPPPPASRAAKAEPPETRTPDEAASPGQSSPEAEVARGQADELCKSDKDRLRLLSRSPTSEEGLRLLAELRCEKLRPELFRLTEHLDYQDPRAVAAEGHSSKVAQAWRARRRTAEPHNRARLGLASGSLWPRRRANRVAARNLPPILMALFGETPRGPTVLQRVRASGGGGSGSGGSGGSGGSAASAGAGSGGSSGSGGGSSGGGSSGGGGPGSSGGGSSGGGSSGGGSSGGGGSGGGGGPGSGGGGGGGSGGGGGGSGGGGGGSGGGGGGSGGGGSGGGGGSH